MAGAVDKLTQCRIFCERVAETAAMQSPAITATEMNLSRLLKEAMLEIRQQLACVEAELYSVSSISLVDAAHY